MKEKRFFSCNSDSYTKEHNDIIDTLLNTYTNVCYNEIYYNTVNECYVPRSKLGLEILEHLRDCDLIVEVCSNEIL